MSDELKLAESMRKSAAEFRRKAQHIREKKMVKCAQVLTAARGLSQLQRILEGAER